MTAVTAGGGLYFSMLEQLACVLTLGERVVRDLNRLVATFVWHLGHTSITCFKRLVQIEVGHTKRPKESLIYIF